METERQIDQTPTTTDSGVFIGGFLDSEEYAQAYIQFYAGKTPSPNVTEQMKTSVFQNREAARLSMIAFAKKRLHFQYDPNQFPDDIQQAVLMYIEATKQLRSARSESDKEGIIKGETYRTAAHFTLADALVKADVIPTNTLALGFAGLILLSEGLDSYESLEVNRSKRTQSMYK